MPPSSDGPHSKRGVPRPPSQRPRDGQKGHTKHQRVILPPRDHRPQAEPVRTPRHPSGRRRPRTISRSDDRIAGEVEARGPSSASHAGLPPLSGPRDCRPEARDGARIGPGLEAAAAYFSGVGRLGECPIRQPLADLHGIPISLGSLSKLEARTARALHSIHDEAIDHIRGLDANVDETGWKQGARKARLRVAVTRLVIAFLIRGHRNRDSFNNQAEPKTGVPTTDRCAVCVRLAETKRRICRAHLRRDFQAMTDRRDQGSELSEGLLCLAGVLAREWSKVVDPALAARRGSPTP